MRQVILFVHLFAAIFWLGEIFAFAILVGPYARTLEPVQQSALFSAIGRRSLPLTWAAIAILIITGILNLTLMGISLSSLSNPTFYRTPFGRDLGLKLLFVLLMLIVSVTHDFVIAARSRKARRAIQEAGESPPEKLVLASHHYRRLARRLGILNFVLALFIVFFAAGLVIYG